jgi:hypothetical protein
MHNVIVTTMLLVYMSGIAIAPQSHAAPQDLPDHPRNAFQEEHATWLKKAVLAYRGVAPDLPGQPTTADDLEKQLVVMYAAEPAGTMNATEIAYWGAMRSAKPEPWIRRLWKDTRLRGSPVKK